MGGADYDGRGYYFAAPTHVYVITLAVRHKSDPSLSRFLASLRLGNRKAADETGAHQSKKPVADASLSPVAASDTQASDQERVFKSKNVTRKALIIWRPEPIYTEEARRNQVHGTVILRAVFHSSGQVTNLRVVSGLENGLTEKALEAARSIRFFPAEKGGKRVSQDIQLEYIFNLF
jgi:TonB family protein